MIITPKNWDSFQHYKNRAPAWIKLHRGLLDDFAFSRLPVASRALAPILWLLASEYDDGAIDAPLEELAFRFRMSDADLRTALTPLIDSGFFLASETLAECKQPACLEKEDIKREYRKEIELEQTAAEAPRARAVEKKSRKGVATALPDNYAIPDRVHAYGIAQGLSSSEIARDHQRFCNHAKQNDRRCVDWEAAERNWLLIAAEKLGRSPPVPPGAAADDGKIEVTDPEQLAAWDDYARSKGGSSFPRNSRGGWRLPSPWPPGYKAPGYAASPAPPVLQTMQ